MFVKSDKPSYYENQAKIFPIKMKFPNAGCLRIFQKNLCA